MPVSSENRRRVGVAGALALGLGAIALGVAGVAGTAGSIALASAGAALSLGAVTAGRYPSLLQDAGNIGRRVMRMVRGRAPAQEQVIVPQPQVNIQMAQMQPAAPVPAQVPPPGGLVPVLIDGTVQMQALPLVAPMHTQPLLITDQAELRRLRESGRNIVARMDREFLEREAKRINISETRGQSVNTASGGETKNNRNAAGRYVGGVWRPHVTVLSIEAGGEIYSTDDASPSRSASGNITSGRESKEEKSRVSTPSRSRSQSL